MRWLVLLAVACQQDPNAEVAEDVRCVVGAACFQHTTYLPEERQRLRQECGGSFSEDDCSDDNALGTCDLPDGSVTVIYTGYDDLAGFISVCKAHGGTWNPA